MRIESKQMIIAGSLVVLFGLLCPVAYFGNGSTTMIAPPTLPGLIAIVAVIFGLIFGARKRLNHFAVIPALVIVALMLWIWLTQFSVSADVSQVTETDPDTGSAIAKALIKSMEQSIKPAWGIAVILSGAALQFCGGAIRLFEKLSGSGSSSKQQS